MKTRNARTRQTSPRNQRGFGMAIALAVLAVFALIAGAIALSNKGGSQKTDLETARVMAQSIINRGNELYMASIRVTQDRDLKDLRLATTGVAPAFGLYDPRIGVANDVSIPGKAMEGGVDASFTLDTTNITVNGMAADGSAALAAAVVLSDVTDATLRVRCTTPVATTAPGSGLRCRRRLSAGWCRMRSVRATPTPTSPSGRPLTGFRFLVL